MSLFGRRHLRALATEPSSKLDIFRLDSDTLDTQTLLENVDRQHHWDRESIYLGMNSAQVGVLKEGDKVSFNRLLESTDGRGLEAEVGLEVLSDLTDQTLEGELSDQQLGGLLITSDLTESDGTRLIPVRLLDTTI